MHPGALQIEMSEESDQGKYECVATNRDGTRYSTPANLYVRGKSLNTFFMMMQQFEWLCVDEMKFTHTYQ